MNHKYIDILYSKKLSFSTTVFPQIRPAAIIFSWGLQLRVLLEITKFHLHKSVPGAGIIRNAGIIRGRALYEEIRYSKVHCPLTYLFYIA